MGWKVDVYTSPKKSEKDRGKGLSTYANALLEGLGKASDQGISTV